MHLDSRHIIALLGNSASTAISGYINLQKGGKMKKLVLTFIKTSFFYSLVVEISGIEPLTS